MGKVYLIGAGPGAADLITLRGAELLRRAEIVFHDALVQREMLAFASGAKLVAVGKRCSQISTDQRFINRTLVEAASRYELVVRLKGGDPMLFGRAQEEIDALDAAGVPYEVVPGVTSALAASAEVGISLTQRGASRSVVFATPRIGDGENASAWAPGSWRPTRPFSIWQWAGLRILPVSWKHTVWRPVHPSSSWKMRRSGNRVAWVRPCTACRMAQRMESVARR